MATPAFRAAGTAVFSANNVANPTALTPTKNGSTVNGDLMLCITAARSITATVGTPNGWTLLTGFPIRSGTASGGSVYVFSRIADGTALDAPTITWTGLTTGTNGDSCGARIHSWQNAVATQAGTVTSTDAAITTSATMPAITTTFGNALIVGIVVKINDTVHTWTVATRAERSDDHTTSGTGHGTVVADIVQTAVGASGTAVATPSTTVSSRSLAITLAMKPVIVTANVNQVTETDLAGHLAVPFGRATETDTAAAMGRLKVKALGQATSAETARRLAVPLGRAVETDTAQPATPTKALAIGQAASPETAGVVTPQQTFPGQTIAIGQAAETSTAGALSAHKTVTVGQATDTSTAGVITFTKAKAIGLASDTSTAQPLSRLRSREVGQASDAETAGILAHAKALLIALVTESSLARALTVGRARTLGQAAEAGTAVAITHSTARAVGRADEADSAEPVTGLRTITLALVVGAESAQPLTSSHARAVGRADETGTATPLLVVRSKLVAAAIDTSTAQAVTFAKAAAIAQAQEASLAGGIAVQGRVSQAFETAVARPISALKNLVVGLAAEVSAATALVVRRGLGVGLQSEADTAAPLGSPTIVQSVQETQTAGVVSPLQSHVVQVGLVVDTSIARPITARIIREQTGARWVLTGRVARDVERIVEGSVARALVVTGPAARDDTIQTGSITR